MAEPRGYTLDTSAIVAYLDDEPGADRIEKILALADSEAVEVYASFMTYMEILYGAWRRHGEHEGKSVYLRLRTLPIRRVEGSERLLVAAARIKASHALSVADAWIAATARTTRSRLVHKDPEFRPLADEIALLELPLGGR